MRTICYTNNKGGVGKTTCAVATAEALARRGDKVLLVDMDAQANATRYAGAEIDGIETVYDVVVEGSCKASEAVQSTSEFDVIAGDPLMADAVALLSAKSVMPCTALADALEELDDAYDWCVIDCPPSLDYVTVNAFVAADDLVIVVAPSKGALDGLGRVALRAAEVQGNKRLNPGLNVAGILVNQYLDNRVRAKSLDEALPGAAAVVGKSALGKEIPVFNSRIHMCEGVGKAFDSRVSLFDYPQAGRAAKDFEAYIAEYLKGAK